MPSSQQNKIVVSQKEKDRCNAQAQQIVINLIDGPLNEDVFLKELRFINQSHYQDVTEERAVIKLCGYPLCNSTLGDIPKKKYHISVSQNKVYDITERKLFCSNHCYKASQYLKAQLHISPLWIRDQEKCTQFNLLKTRTELIGEEIDFQVERVKLPFLDEKVEKKIDTNRKEDTFASKVHDVIPKMIGKICNDNSITENGRMDVPMDVERTLDNIVKDSINHQPLMLMNTKSSSVELFINKKCQESLESSPESSIRNESKNITNSSSQQIFEVKEQSMKKPHFNNIQLKTSIQQTRLIEIGINSASDSIKKVERGFQEWISVDTLCFIMDKKIVAQMMRDKGCKWESTRVQSDPLLYKRYNAICKKLDLLELDNNSNENNCEVPTQPLPDYNLIKEKTAEMEIKVRSFYQGDAKVSFAFPEKNDNEEIPCNFLPPIHQHSKNSIRRNIVVDKLKNTLPSICCMLDVSHVYIFSRIKKLVFTFRFSAHNITYKPAEWNLIILIILKLLSINDIDLQNSFTNKSEFIKTTLMSHKCEPNYLDSLCTRITELESVLKNEEI